MKYMMLIHYDEKAWIERSVAERRQIFGEYLELIQQMEARGQYLGGNPLQPTSVASRVRVCSGKPFITDGPFAETHEQFGGYMLIEARDLDEAMGIATRIPAARYGMVEVRPVMDLEDHFGGPAPTTAEHPRPTGALAD